jgi:hypothetical protein
LRDTKFEAREVYHLTMNDPATYPSRHLIALGSGHYLMEVYQNEQGRLCVALSVVDVT